jgi:hypothetical protein
MQENDHRPVGGSGIDYLEDEVAAAELFHRLTVTRRAGLVTLGGDE